MLQLDDVSITEESKPARFSSNSSKSNSTVAGNKSKTTGMSYQDLISFLSNNQ